MSDTRRHLDAETEVATAGFGLQDATLLPSDLAKTSLDGASDAPIPPTLDTGHAYCVQPQRELTMVEC